MLYLLIVAAVSLAAGFGIGWTVRGRPRVVLHRVEVPGRDPDSWLRDFEVEARKRAERVRRG